MQKTGRRATKRIELDRVNNARLLDSKEMCSLKWKRHNKIRNENYISQKYVGNSHRNENRTLRYTTECKANKRKSRADYDVKTEKACCCEENSNWEFRDGQNETKSGEAYISKSSHIREIKYANSGRVQEK